MHVVIVGCGRVGSTLGRELVSAGHTVAVVDRKAEAFSRLGESFTGQKIMGIGFDRDVLIEAGIQKAGALAAVTNGDNSNILIARVAREEFGIERVVARIYDPKRAEIYERLGIATVATVKWTSERILRRILPDLPAVEWTDPSAKVVLVERELPKAIVGTRVLSLDSAIARVVAIRRLGTAIIPTADTVVQEGDVAYVAAEIKSLETFDKSLVVATGKDH
ncbi:MAG: TrkA family potassium uptake protein [Actinobacteria bacterium]|nr:MAG: potassium transporter TrkA [Acidimicrobium sp. BACL17 MAG-120823-bin42]MDA0192557.1 TrkA family potassium uptake protein [Actinomycetota bacterium]MDA2952616.1 TrkA family potassium uptake protein [Actinomycetota bacterium]MDA2999227.1 TrkA family potassium uptake protein [Actinomycetota bacterium]